MALKTSAQNYFDGTGLQRQSCVLSVKGLEKQLLDAKPFWRGGEEPDFLFLANATEASHPCTLGTVLDTMARTNSAYAARLGSAWRGERLSPANHGRRALRNSPKGIDSGGAIGSVVSDAPAAGRPTASRDDRNASIKALEDLIRRRGSPAQVTRRLVESLDTDRVNLNTMYRAIRMIDSAEAWTTVCHALKQLVADGVIEGKLTVSRIIAALAHSRQHLEQAPLDYQTYERLCVSLTERGFLSGSVLVPVAVGWLQAAEASAVVANIERAVSSVARWGLGAEFPVYIAVARLLQTTRRLAAEDRDELTLSGVAMQLHAFACHANAGASTPCFAVQFGSDLALAIIMYADQRANSRDRLWLTELMEALDTLVRLGYRCDPTGILLTYAIAGQTKTDKPQAIVLEALANHRLFSVGHVPVDVLVHLLHLSHRDKECASVVWGIAQRLSADELAHYSHDAESCRCTVDFDTTLKMLVAFCQPTAAERTSWLETLFEHCATPRNHGLMQRLNAFLFR